MKNSEVKNRISSIYPSPLPNSPSFEDPSKKELDEEIKKVEKELNSKFAAELAMQAAQSKGFEKENQKLKLLLNKLKSENTVKLNKIQFLKSQIASEKSEFENRNSSSHRQETTEKLETLLYAISRIESEIEKELNQRETLIEMKNTESKGVKILKERLKKELVQMEKIGNDYEKKKNLKILMKLQNKSVQHHLQETKKTIQKNEENFIEEFAILQNSKKVTEKEIKKSIENISKANLKLRETKNSFNKIMQSLDEYNLENQERINKVQISNLKISEVREQLRLIKKFYPDCPEFSEPLTEADISFIISAYFKLKFQEYSLSLKFENLTEEQIDKQKKCDFIREELEKIKKNEGVQTKYLYNKNLTFNEIKSLLEDHKILEKKQVFEYTQKTLLRIYLKIVNIASVARTSLATVAKNSKFHSNDNRVLLALDEIKALQRNPRHVQTSGYLVKRRNTKLFERKKTYKTDFDLQEDQQTSKINLKKIKESLKKYSERQSASKGETKLFDLIDLTECAQLINHDIIVCFLIELNELDSKIIENLSDSYRLILEINKVGIESFKGKFRSLMSSLTEIINWITQKTSTLKIEVLEFYKHCSPDDVEVLNKELSNSHLPFKVLVKYLLENSEQFKASKKKHSEEPLPNGGSTKSSYDDQVIKRNDLTTNDKTLIQSSFNFTLGTFRTQNNKFFEDRLKSLSTRNLTQQSQRIRPANSYKSLGASLKNTAYIARATSGF